MFPHWVPLTYRPLFKSLSRKLYQALVQIALLSPLMEANADTFDFWSRIKSSCNISCYWEKESLVNKNQL